MGHVKVVLQRKRIGRGKSQVIPSLMPKPRATPEALITTASVKAAIKDIARRRRQANGHALLMPQAEAVVQEDAGGLGYAAPSTGNNNYAASLPAGVGTTDANKAIKQVHKKLPKVTQRSDTTPLSGLKEGAFKELETNAQDDAYALGHKHGYAGEKKQPTKEHAEHYHEGYASGKFARSEDSINDAFEIAELEMILEASPEYNKWKSEVVAHHGIGLKYKTKPQHTKAGWDYVTTAHKNDEPVATYSHSHVKAVLAGKHGEEARKKMEDWTNEELIHEAKGGLVIIHPDHQHEYPHLIGKRMYKAGPADKGHSDVFVHTSTHNVDLQRLPNKHLKVPSQKDYNHFFDSRRRNEEIIVSLSELEPIFEAYKKGKSPKPSATKGMEDDSGILEGALETGALHGLRGHELPQEHVTKKFGATAQQYYKGLLAGKQEREKRERPKSGFLDMVGEANYSKGGARRLVMLPGRTQASRDKLAAKNTVNHMTSPLEKVRAPQEREIAKQIARLRRKYVKEELKVGEGQDNSPESKSDNRVKRKYLGTQRGRTATGKRAHAIDVMPVIQKPDKNVNKTTPGSPLKRTT